MQSLVLGRGGRSSGGQETETSSWLEAGGVTLRGGGMLPGLQLGLSEAPAKCWWAAGALICKPNMGCGRWVIVSVTCSPWL